MARLFCREGNIVSGLTDLPAKPVLRVSWIALALMLVAFHIGLVFLGLVPNLVSRPLHLALILPWVFLFGVTNRRLLVSGAVLCAIGVTSAVWVAWNHDMLGDQYGFLESRFQVVVGFALLAVVIEAARRAIGWPLPTVAALALIYAFFGQHIPGEFGHSGLPLRSFLGSMTIAEGGIWGSLTAVSVGVVSIFVIFGAVLNAGEAGQGFMNVAAAAAGSRRSAAAARRRSPATAAVGSDGRRRRPPPRCGRDPPGPEAAGSASRPLGRTGGPRRRP